MARAAVPDEWFTLVTVGRLDRFMPGFTSLSDDQRWSVVGYALSLGLDPARWSDGERVFGQSCAGCHGASGSGTDAGPDLTRTDFQARRSEQAIFDTVTQGAAPEMPGFEGSLTEDERWAVADFVRHLGLTTAEPTATPTLEAGPTAEGTAPGETAVATSATVESAAPTVGPTAVAGGSLTGTIVNGTADAAVPHAVEVTLHGFDGDTEVLTETAPARADGTFTFVVTELVPGRLYVATVDYLGSLYASDIVHLTSDAPSASLPITIYETTTDASMVQVDRLHVLVSAPGEGVLQIVELWILSNPGDRTVIPPEGGNGLEGTLPEGAVNVSFDETTPGERFQVGEGSFFDNRPLPPGSGTGEWVFSYSLPYQRQLDLLRTAAYPIGSIVVLVPEGLKVAADGLTDTGTRDVQGQSLHTYSLGAVAVGSEVRLRLSGQPAAAVTVTPTSPWILGVAVLAVALIGAGLLWFRPRRQRHGDEEEEEEEDGDAGESADALMLALATLDRDFEAGKVAEADYRTQREDLKSRALEAMRRS